MYMWMGQVPVNSGTCSYMQLHAEEVVIGYNFLLGGRVLRNLVSSANRNTFEEGMISGRSLMYISKSIVMSKVQTVRQARCSSSN